MRHAHPVMMAGEAAERWPLSERGQRQAEQIAALPFWSEVKGIWCSPEGKALSTIAQAAARHRLPIYVEEDLRELVRTAEFLEDYQGAVAACFAQPEVSHLGWEPAAQVQRRMLGVLQRLAEEQAGPIALVGHGLSLSLMLAGVKGQPAPTLAEWRGIPMPGWAALEMPAGELVVAFQQVEG